MSEFHFIRPWWLTTIILLIAMVFLLKKYRLSQSGWQQFLPKHLATVLVDGSSQTKALSLTWPFIIGLLSIIALAGPSWQKLPQPVYQVARGSVLIMDMSYSMYSTDVPPNRLTRARYKAIDLLENINEGELGLIAYAGDAFVISPLTDDINNIKLLLPSLTPELMPELGSNPLAALTLAHEMLLNAGHNEGDIYWFTDGIDNIDIQDITQWSRSHPYRLNVLGIGTTAGAPIKLANGELMKDHNGAIIVPKLTDSALKGTAERGRGKYVTLAHDNSDIEQLTQQPVLAESEKSPETDSTGDQWQEFGPYLLLLVLPMLLGYFRRGALLTLLPLGLFFSSGKPVYADIWQDLWKTKDQQGKQHFEQQQFQQAAEQFDDPLWQGTSYYKAGDYQQALTAFQQHDSAQALFNQGNALAKLQQFDEAIARYQQALSKDANLTDAKSNLELLEKLKQQQEQQNNENQQDQDNEQQGDESSDSQQDQQQQGQENAEQQDGEESQPQNQQSGQPSQDQQQKNSEASDPENNDQQEQKNQQNSEQQEANEEKAQQDAQNKDADEQQSEQAMSAEAKLAAEQQAKETEQKHQQLLNKVTDDPYLLLRNKMQLEYQKRRQDRSNVGVQKKW